MRGFVVGLALSVATTAAAGDGSTVSLDEGRLTVVARAERAASVMAEVERVAGVRIQLPQSVAYQPLTAEVRGVPVEKAIRALMQRLSLINLAVIYDRDTMRFIAFPTPAPGGTDPRIDELEEYADEMPETDATGESLDEAAVDGDDAVRVAAVRD